MKGFLFSFWIAGNKVWFEESKLFNYMIQWSRDFRVLQKLQ